MMGLREDILLVSASVWYCRERRGDFGLDEVMCYVCMA